MRNRLPFLGDAGVMALARATAAATAGDKLGALRAYSQAYSAFRSSGASKAAANKARAAQEIALLVFELGTEAFGPDLCPHGSSKTLVCWVCSDAKLALAKTEPPLAMTEPTDAVATLYAGVGERAQLEKELTKKAGGSDGR